MIGWLRRALGLPKTRWVIWEHPDELGYYAIKEECW
ncbi:hypothetical protein SEA_PENGUINLOVER67_64 [Mycobacterium phage PenguinLover67]|nr:hypothetical protein SEA_PENGUINLOVER67_64 [Mycobacterium phage PenguinLover67]